MRTIRRNSKELTTIFELAVQCKVYTLENSFTGKDCESKYARSALETAMRGKVYHRRNDIYVVHIHGNHWYEIWAPIEPTPATRD